MYTVCQTLFSCLLNFVSVSLFQGALYMGYPTIYTMFMLASIVLDSQLPETTVLMYPELYASLKHENMLSTKVFFVWLAIVLFQSGVIMIMILIYFDNTMFTNIVAITFCVMFVMECLIVGAEMTRWHPLAVYGQLTSLLFFAQSILFLRSSFDLKFFGDDGNLIALVLIVAAAWLPLQFTRVLWRRFNPPQHKKLTESECMDGENFAQQLFGFRFPVANNLFNNLNLFNFGGRGASGDNNGARLAGSSDINGSSTVKEKSAGQYNHDRYGYGFDRSFDAPLIDEIELPDAQGSAMQRRGANVSN